MISDELTIVIPSTQNGELLINLINQLSNQTDIQRTKVLIIHSQGEPGEFIHQCNQKESLDIELYEGTHNLYENINIGLNECKTEFFLSILPGVTLIDDQTIYNCLIDLKSKQLDVIRPSLKVPSETLVDKLNNSMILMRYNQLNEKFPYAPAEFLFVRTSTISSPGFLNTTEIDVDESFNLSMSLESDRFISSKNEIILPDGVDLILNYLENVRLYKHKRTLVSEQI